LKLASGDIKEVELNSLDFIQPFFNINIVASAGIQDLGIEKKKDMSLWTVTASEWEKYGELLHVFKEGDCGHQYLDSGGDYVYHFQIIVSVNEYSEDWVGWLKQ
jgi:hypothetical protein